MKILLLILTAFFTHSAFSQNIGIGTTAPKSKLHIAGGLRVDTLINNQDSGLLRHDKNGVVYSLKFTGNAADVLRGNGSFGPAGAASSGWSLTGNSGTNPANNFIGTTDDQPLLFKINNVAAGVIDRGKLNTVLGYSALPNNNGQKNTVIGYQAMLYNTTGDWNTANGYWALRANTTGKFNTAMGTGSLWSNLSGNANTAIGNDALSSNTEGVGNSAFGLNALKSAVTGDFNTAIGTESDVLGGGLSNATAIGAYTRVDCSNCMILGSVNGVNTATNNVNVGIGVTNPKTRLHVAGSLRFDTLNNTLDSGLIRHDKTGVVYSLKFTGNVNDVLRGNGSFGPAGAALVGWSLTGNSGLNPVNNFIGTTDNQPLVFKVNNTHAGKIASTGNNIFMGFESGIANTTGTSNAGFGYWSLKKNTTGSENTANGVSALTSNSSGIRNTAIGSFALSDNTVGHRNTATGSLSLSSNIDGSYNTSNGCAALESNTSGSDNSAFGYGALNLNTSGNDNTAIGYRAMNSNTLGFSNSAIGYNAMFLNTAGSYNTANGYEALVSNENGSNNTADGAWALKSNYVGVENTAIGTQSLSANYQGSYNTAVGFQALISNVGGSGNTAIGFKSNASGANLANATAIGANAIVGSSNSLVLGGIGANAVKVGIGVTSPIATLHVKGSAKFFSGADTHTGEFYAGTSNQDGIELVSSGTDAYASIQRTSNYGLHISKKNVISNSGLVGFLVNGILVGSITTNGTNTSYLTTSDKRLKENIVTSKYGLQTILQIKVADYNYKADNKKALQTGFLAQELFELYPQAVERGGDDEKTDPWMIDYSKLTPLLVKSIQDQQQIINRQQEELKELYNKIDKLIALYQTLTKN